MSQDPPDDFEVVFPDEPTPPPPPPRGPWHRDLIERVTALFRDPAWAFRPPAHLALWLVPIVLLAIADLSRSLSLRELIIADAEQVALEMDLPEDARDEALAMAERSREWEATPVAVVELLVVWLFNAFIFVFGTGGLFYAGLNYILGGRARYLDVVMVISLTGIIAVLRTALLTPIMRAKESLEITASPAIFFAADSGILYRAAKLFDIFDLYRIFLLTVGFAVVARVPWRRTAGLVLSFWGIWAALALLGGL